MHDPDGSSRTGLGFYARVAAVLAPLVIAAVKRHETSRDEAAVPTSVHLVEYARGIP